MRKTILIGLLTILTVPLYAEHVDRHTAERVAVQWMAGRQSSATIARMEPVLHSSDTVCYLFSFSPEGFVIVSADNAAYPVLGYSDVGTLTDYENAPVADYIQFASKTIARTIQDRIQPDDRISAEWQSILANNLSYKKAADASVGPLVEATWGQEAPFNTACPDSGCSRGFGSNSYCLAGCVAVAMAQIMHYHQYPATGYSSRNGYDFGSTTYNWSLLPASISKSASSDIASEVAKIMRHIGVAVDMNYGCSSSGASLFNARNAFFMYFRYQDSPDIIARSQYSESGWNYLLKADLDASKPIIYAGLDENDENGHAWICDGYEINGSTTYYHMNWGWNGSYNGNFLLTDITPASYDFSFTQQAIINITPYSTTPQLGLSKTLWTVESSGGTSDAIQVTNSSASDQSSFSYTVSSNATWLTVSVNSGTTPGSFTITAEENTSGATRTGSVTVTASGVSGSPKTVTVSQAGTTSDAASLSVSKMAWAAPSSGGISPVIAVTNGSSSSTLTIAYAISVNADWLTLSTASGTTPGSFTITASSNTTGTQRSAAITITSTTADVNNSPATIYITQPSETTGGDSLTVSPGSWVASSSPDTSGTISIDVPGKAYDVSIQSNVTWLTASVSEATTPASILLYASDNSTGTIRTGTVTIDIPGYTISGAPYTLQVTQAGSSNEPVLSVSVISVAFDNAGGTSQSIAVINGNAASSESIDFTIAESLSWANVSIESGTTPAHFTITAESNTSGTIREGTVTISSVSSGVSGSPATIALTQSAEGTGSSPTLTVSPRFWTAPGNGGISAEYNITNSGASGTISYTIASDAAWLRTSSLTGTTPGTLSLIADRNETGNVRFAVVRVNAITAGVENSPQDIYITQPTASNTVPVLGIDPSVISISSAGNASYPVSIFNASTGNTDIFEFSIEETVSWITVSELSGQSGNTISLDITQNTSDSTRTGTIRVVAGSGVELSPQYITISQSARIPGSYIEVATQYWNPSAEIVTSPAIIVLGAEGMAGIPYRITTDVPWLSTSWTYGTTPGTFSITTAKNNSSASRTGHVYVSSYVSGIYGTPHVITVEQQANTGSPALGISMHSWTAPVSGGSSEQVSVSNANTSDNTSIDYSIISSSLWLTTSHASGITPGTFSITAEPNSNSGSRTGSITVQSATNGVLDGTHTISVYQPGYATALLSCATGTSESPDISAQPGDVFSIVVSLSKSIYSTNGKTIELGFSMQFDHSGLYPVSVTGLQGTCALERTTPGTIVVSIKGKQILAGDIVRIKMEVLLGNNETTLWTLNSPYAIPQIAEAGLSESCQGTVTVLPRSGYTTRSDLGIANLENIYPNPATTTDASYVTIRIVESGIITVRMYDTMGNTVATLNDGYLDCGAYSFPFSSATFAPGMYIVTLQSGSETQSQPLIITR